MIAWTDLLTALGLVLVIEGAAYALFPGGIQRACEWLRQGSAGWMRRIGLLAMATGLVVIWLSRGA